MAEFSEAVKTRFNIKESFGDLNSASKTTLTQHSHP